MAANTRFACAVLAAAVLLTAVPARAQQTPVFRSGTSIVEVTVIVRDRDGRFVRDLTAADFEVREGDAERRVEMLYLVERPATGSARAPGVASEPGAGPVAPRTFVFLFDMEHLSPGGLTRAREAASAFGGSRLLPSDLSGAVALGGVQSGRISGDHRATVETIRGLRPRSDRTSRDRENREWPRILSLLEASEIAAKHELTLIRVRDRACEERQLNCIGESFEAKANRHTVEQELTRKAVMYVGESRAAAERSIGALAQMAALLEALPGRKTIVWFTEGTWPEEIAEQARQSAFRASQSGVAVYTIDPRGLGRQAERAMDAAPAEVGLAFLQDMDDLSNLMAVGTGGLFIRSESNLGRALATVEDDTSTYYVLGYAAAAGEDRSKYRQLSVRLRREGLSARVRHGFMAPQRVTASPGSMVATAMPPVPGANTALPLPGTASVPLARPTTTVPTSPPDPTPPSDPTPPPSTVPTVPTGTHVPTTSLNVSRLRDLSGASASDLAARGWAAYEKGDLETALPLLEQAASREDVRPWALYALGFTYVGHGRPKDAIAAWERVRAAEPAFAPVYLDLAATYGQMAEVTRALAVLREAAARWPGNPDSHNGIGVLLVRRGAISEAIDAFTKATTAAPDDPLSWLNLGRAYELRYDRGRRYDEQLQKWTGPEADRVKAEQSYKRCVALGGPYASQAAEALARMAWS